MIRCHPSRGHTVLILALEQPSIHRVDRLYSFVIPSLPFFLSAKRMTWMVCNGKGCLNFSQNVTACKNFTSQTCAAEVFCSTNLRTHTHGCACKHTNTHVQQTYICVGTSKTNEPWFARLTGSCSWNPSTRVQDELMESG